MSGKEKNSKLALDFPPMVSALVVITFGSEPVSTADGDGTLTSSFSVYTVTTNTIVSTSTTAPTASHIATENCLSMMEKSIACLGDTLARFIEGQKIPSSGTFSWRRHRSRSRHRNHYSYYRRFRSRSSQNSVKSSRHYYGYQHGSRSPSQISHLMPRNQILMTNMRNAPTIGMKMRRMCNRVLVIIRMWVTYLLGTSKQLCQCLLQ